MASSSINDKDLRKLANIALRCKRVENRILRFRIDLRSFSTDDAMADLLIKPIELIAEDAKGLSEAAFSAAFGSTPKHELFAFRNLLVHDYDNINFELAWGIITRDVPELLRTVLGINGVNERLTRLEDRLDPRAGDPLSAVLDGLKTEQGINLREKDNLER